MSTRTGLAAAFAVSLAVHLGLASLLEARPGPEPAGVRMIALRIPESGEGSQPQSRPAPETAEPGHAAPDPVAVPQPPPPEPDPGTAEDRTSIPQPAPAEPDPATPAPEERASIPQPAPAEPVPATPAPEERASIPQPETVPSVPVPKPAAGPPARPAPAAARIPPRSTPIPASPLLAGIAEPPAGAGDPEAALSYQQQVRREINRHKRYPSAAFSRGIEGTVLIELTLARSGSHLHSAVVQSSGSPILDRAAERTARAGEYRPAPARLPGERFTFRIPLTYSIR